MSSYTNLSPMLQVKKAVNYAESSDDDEDVFVAMKAAKSRRRNRPQSRVVYDDDDGDVYEESKESEVVDENGRFIELMVLVEYIAGQRLTLYRRDGGFRCF